MAEPCGDILTAGYSTVLDCVREADHEGPHRSFGGSEWDRRVPEPKDVRS